MKCSNCGAEVHIDSKFCPHCGARIEINNDYNSGGYSGNNYGNNNSGYSGNNYGNNSGNGGYGNNYGSNSGNGSYGNRNYNNKPPKKTNPLIIVIIILAAIILFVLAMLVSNVMMSGVNPFAKATPTPSPTPTPIVTEAPVVTPEVIYITPEPQVQQQVQQPVPPPPMPHENTESVVRYPSYSTYKSSKFNFSCNYPSHYLLYDDGLNTSLYTVRAADGNAIEKICAKVNEGETVAGQLQNYIDTHRGYVEYKTSGSDYFAVSIANGTMHSYKYCKFKYGNLYWFEFEYNTVNYADVYDEYINDIYRSFSIY